MRIMIVDDEPLVIDTVSMLIRRLGHQPITARRGEQAVTVFRRDRPHLLILDLGLPDISGLEVLERVRECHPAVPVIMLTGNGMEELERRVRAIGVRDFFLKGSSLGPLKEAIEQALSAAQPIEPSRPAS